MPKDNNAVKRGRDLQNPEIRAKATAARTAKAAARGAGYGALVSMALIEHVFDATGQMPSPVNTHRLKGGEGPRNSENSRWNALVQGGYLERVGGKGSWVYAIIKRVDQSLLRNKDKRALKEALIRFDATQRDSEDSVERGDFGATAQTLALQSIARALKPFARYGEKIADAADQNAIPLLMRRDGLHNSDFKKASFAYAKLWTLLGNTPELDGVDAGETGEASPAYVDQDSDLDRFFGV